MLALEIINETDLIGKTSALKADTPTPIMSPSQEWSSARPMVPQTKVVTSIPMGHHRQKKLYSSPSAVSSVHSPISTPSYSSISGASGVSFDSLDLSDPSVQHSRRSAEEVPPHVGAASPDAASNTSAAPSGSVQPPVSPHDGCCALNMVQRRGSQDCCCVYPVRIVLFLGNVSLNSNWSNEFLEELASQLNLRVTQFEIVNFYVLGTSGINMTMDIVPHTGNSFSSNQVIAMKNSLSLLTVRINPALVGGYYLVDLMWFRPLAPAHGHGNTNYSTYQPKRNYSSSINHSPFFPELPPPPHFINSTTEISTGHGHSKTRIKICKLSQPHDSLFASSHFYPAKISGTSSGHALNRSGVYDVDKSGVYDVNIKISSLLEWTIQVGMPKGSLT